MQAFPELIAAALHEEWGASPSARKAVGLLTQANERAVRNWFDGRNGPSGENLVCLIRHSDAVLSAVLRASQRDQLLPAVALLRLKSSLRSALDNLEQAFPG
ncbi:hypothetical protein [uncultured Brevundimonas sp.]|uniref:hypothetical protein n=1 Tax=uncultured Brevundimonas sp. TaxID=213418 RepID=UPI0025935999|nr:hypothetical protein [uncultured Brevundimonas sp.]